MHSTEILDLVESEYNKLDHVSLSVALRRLYSVSISLPDYRSQRFNEEITDSTGFKLLVSQLATRCRHLSADQSLDAIIALVYFGVVNANDSPATPNSSSVDVPLVYAVHEQLMKSHVNNLAADQLCQLSDVLCHLYCNHNTDPQNDLLYAIGLLLATNEPSPLGSVDLHLAVRTLHLFGPKFKREYADQYLDVILDNDEGETITFDDALLLLQALNKMQYYHQEALNYAVDCLAYSVDLTPGNPLLHPPTTSITTTTTSTSTNTSSSTSPTNTATTTTSTHHPTSTNPTNPTYDSLVHSSHSALLLDNTNPAEPPSPDTHQHHQLHLVEALEAFRALHGLCMYAEELMMHYTTLVNSMMMHIDNCSEFVELYVLTRQMRFDSPSLTVKIADFLSDFLAVDALIEAPLSKQLLLHLPEGINSTIVASLIQRLQLACDYSLEDCLDLCTTLDRLGHAVPCDLLTRLNDDSSLSCDNRQHGICGGRKFSNIDKLALLKFKYPKELHNTPIIRSESFEIPHLDVIIAEKNLSYSRNVDIEGIFTIDHMVHQPANRHVALFPLNAACFYRNTGQLLPTVKHYLRRVVSSMTHQLNSGPLSADTGSPVNGEIIARVIHMDAFAAKSLEEQKELLRLKVQLSSTSALSTSPIDDEFTMILGRDINVRLD